jgi:hypothetical protein
MAIRILDNKIEIGNFSLEENDTGIQFDGTAKILTNELFSVFQGTVSGYTSGGLTIPPPAASNIIDKFPFASDTNASDVGDLTVARYFSSGHSSKEHGYTANGNPPASGLNTIDRFPFASNGNAADVGDTARIDQRRNGGISSRIHGYVTGGTPALTPANSTSMEKFTFAASASGSDVGDLTQGRYTGAGASSQVSGYVAGGQSNAEDPAVPTNVIDKFPFATNANATDVGNLTGVAKENRGHSSETSGYSSGGFIPPAVNTIEKWPFATDTNATDVGDLTRTAREFGTSCSTVSGYSSGGQPAPTFNTIDKFPFATDGNATDVGDLTVGRYYCSAGQQV